MNNLYRLELTSMLMELDAYLDSLFSHYGFYESDKLTKAEFKAQLLQDYTASSLPPAENKNA
jgi:hypothetical protein